MPFLSTLTKPSRTCVVVLEQKSGIFQGQHLRLGSYQFLDSELAAAWPVQIFFPNKSDCFSPVLCIRREKTHESQNKRCG
jgi:hypothetical protein